MTSCKWCDEPVIYSHPSHPDGWCQSCNAIQNEEEAESDELSFIKYLNRIVLLKINKQQKKLTEIDKNDLVRFIENQTHLAGLNEIKVKIDNFLKG